MNELELLNGIQRLMFVFYVVTMIGLITIISFLVRIYYEIRKLNQDKEAKKDSEEIR